MKSIRFISYHCLRSHTSEKDFQACFYFSVGIATKNQEEIRMTVIMFIIVAAFLICNTPRIYLYIYQFINLEQIIECKSYYLAPMHCEVMKEASKFSLTLNSTIHFFVYFLVGRRFRTELYRVLGIRSKVWEIGY